MPIGAHATISGDTVCLTGLIAEVSGATLLKDTLSGPLSAAAEIGRRLAEALLDRGGKAILDAVYCGNI